MIDSAVEPERFAERCLILTESAEGLMARTNRLDKALRSDEKRFKALKEPEWKGVRSKLSKAFPELGDLSRDSKYESFQKSAAGTMAELKYAYELFLDLEAHCAVHVATLKAMCAQFATWDLNYGRESVRAFMALFTSFCRLVALAGMVDERKLVCALYAAAHACARGSSEPKFGRLAQQSLRSYDEPFKTVQAVFADYVPQLGTLVKNLVTNVMLVAGGSGELLRRNALTMIEDAASLGNHVMVPLEARDKGKAHVRLLHGELLEGRASMDFVVFATLGAPGILADPACLVCCQMACEDCLVAGVYRSATVNVHSELEALGKQFPPRNYPGKWPRDLKLAKTFKEWSKNAVLNCGPRHRERRAYLCGEIDIMHNLFLAVPGLVAPKAPLAVAACALALDEALWALRHHPANGAAAYPPKYRVKHYDADAFAAPDLPKLCGYLSDLAALLRRDRACVALYHVRFLATADAASLAALGPRAADALPGDHVPRGAPAFLRAVGDRLLAFGADDARPAAQGAEAAMVRGERDGVFVGGDGGAAGVKASATATLRLDWRRVHFVLTGSTHASSMLKDGAVVDAITRCNLACDHAALADGSLVLRHCDVGVLWPYRQILDDFAAAAVKGPDYLAPQRCLKTCLAVARYARRSCGHPACDGDLGELEGDAKAFADRTLDVVQQTVGACLRTIAAKEDQLQQQIAPVQAAYRAERREAAQRDLDRKGSGERAKDEPPAGYESLPVNAKAIEPLALAESKLANLLNWCKRDHREAAATVDGDLDCVVVCDAKYRPVEAARDAVLTFLDKQIPRAFFADDGVLVRPTSAERTVDAALNAAARAANYFRVDYIGHVHAMLGGPPGWTDPGFKYDPATSFGSALGVKVAKHYVKAVLDLPPRTVYCPDRVAFQNAETRHREPTWQEQILQGAELDALYRVLGRDGARCVDAALCRAAVDEMAKCKKCICSKGVVKALQGVKAGRLTGDWVPHAVALKDAGVLDGLADAALRLGNVLALRQLSREALARTSQRCAPHALKAALLALDTVDGATAAALAPRWLLPPPAKPYDPVYHKPVEDEDSPLYEALARDCPFGTDPFERDGALHAEASGLVDHAGEWDLAPYAFAAALFADAWKPARWVSTLQAFNTGHHVISLAIKAIAHVSAGPVIESASAKRAQQSVADFVAAASAIVTWMRLKEKEPLFADLPLRAQCVFIEKVSCDANLPRSFLDEHLPYPVIHSALMDISNPAPPRAARDRVRCSDMRLDSRVAPSLN